MIKKLLLAVITTGFVLSLNSQAKIYKTIDENGNAVFTDAPSAPEEGEEVTLKPLTPIQFDIPEEPTITGQESETEEKDKPNYKELVIVEPENGSTFRGDGNIKVKVKHRPALYPNHMLALFINGQQAGTPQTGTVFKLKNVSRGEYTLQVKILDSSGKEWKAASSTVYVFRPIIRKEPKAIPKPRPIPVPD